MAQILKFYDESHVYELDGEEIPSVSELSRFASREIYGEIAQYTLDNAAERGTKVHKACENLDRYGDCEVDESIAPYVKAYLAFLNDYKPEWECIEKALASEEKRFAGTLDRVGKLNNGKTAIVDLKTSYAVQKVLANIQLNGYEHLYHTNFGKRVDELYILHLKNDGTYKLIEFPHDTELLNACLTLHNALKKKKRGKKNG